MPTAYEKVCEVIDEVKLDDRAEDTDVYASRIMDAVGSDRPMTLAQLRADINAVVLYNWRDEERDFNECGEEGNDNAQAGHIFLPLQRLAAFIEED